MMNEQTAKTFEWIKVNKLIYQMTFYKIEESYKSAVFYLKVNCLNNKNFPVDLNEEFEQIDFRQIVDAISSGDGIKLVQCAKCGKLIEGDYIKKCAEYLRPVSQCRTCTMQTLLDMIENKEIE